MMMMTGCGGWVTAERSKTRSHAERGDEVGMMMTGCGGGVTAERSKSRSHAERGDEVGDADQLPPVGRLLCVSGPK